MPDGHQRERATERGMFEPVWLNAHGIRKVPASLQRRQFEREGANLGGALRPCG